MLDIRSPSMQGRYIVQENINFESFLKVMGVTDDTKIEEMIKATKGGAKWNTYTSPPQFSELETLREILGFHLTGSGCQEVSLADNGDGTWTQVSGLKTSTFPINQEYKVTQSHQLAPILLDGKCHIKVWIWDLEPCQLVLRLIKLSF